MEYVTKLFDEGGRTRFYVAKPNRRGWSVVYLSYAFGDEVSRFSCGMKVKFDYWRKGEIKLPWSATKTERMIHERVAYMLQQIKDVIDDATANLLNGNDVSVIATAKEFITSNIMGKKKRERFIPIWKNIIYEYDNEKSQKSLLGIVGTFERYMKECNVEDDMASLTTSTIRNFRDWVSKQNLTANRANQLIKYVGTLCNKMKKKGLEHSVDISAIELVKELVGKEERIESNVALTVDEVESLRKLNLEGTKKIVRDLFLIQCWGGCRHEDLGLFLSSKNLKSYDEGDLIQFTPQKTEKEGTTSSVPLSAFYPSLMVLWETYRDYDDSILRGRYNRILKTIAKEAQLNREITVKKTKGTKKTVEVKKVSDLITSHDGRRTFITAMIRDFGKSAEDVIAMSGHTDTTMINNVYLTLSKEDKGRTVLRKAKEGKGITTSTSSKPNRTNNYLIEGREEAMSVLRFLGVPFDDDITFDDAVGRIALRQYQLTEDLGVSVDLLKSLFNLSLPMSKRVESLVSVMRVLSTR